MSFVICDGCRVLNPEGVQACENCGLPLTSTISPVTPVVIAGRYRIIKSVGRGGMGTIYKAHDTVLDDVVALKLVRPDLARLPDMNRRWRSEIRLARRVAHRNVCRIYEYGDDGEMRFISMEFVDGTDLRRVLHTGGPLRGRDGIALALQIATGLQAIHDAGIIHRDLKTPNIMLDDTGTVKVMDFGIAKEFAPDVPSSTGGLMGTPEYMSPEQVLGEPIDFRSDLYSFGVVFYELFTGDVPFRGPTPGATLFKHVYEPSPFDDPARRLERHMPPGVIQICRRCLARHASDRYASATELVAALTAALGDVEAAPAAPEIAVGLFPAKRDWRTLTLGSELLAPLTDPIQRRQRVRRALRASVWISAAALLAVAAYSARRVERPVDARTAALRELPRSRPSAPPPAAVAPLEAHVEPARTAVLPTPAPRAVRLAKRPPEAPPSEPPLRGPASTTTPPSVPTTVAPNSPEPTDRQLAAEKPPAVRTEGDADLWLTRLRSGSDAERAEAALALGGAGPRAVQAVPALSAALRDGDGYVRSCAAQALGRLGSAARDAAPWLADALGDRDERVRAAAADALPRLGPATARTVGALLGALRDDSPRVRALAAHALGQTADGGPEIVRALRRALKDDQTMVRRSAEMALSTLGSPAR